MYHVFRSSTGFTLIEVLVTVTLLSVLTGVGILNLANYKNRHSFDLDTTNVLSGLRSAQNKAILGDQGSAWGVTFTSDTAGGFYEVFSGTSYTTSSVLLYQALSGATAFANPSPGFSHTVIFAKGSGIPDTGHAIVLRGGTGTSVNVISMSASGSLKQTPSGDLAGYWPFDEDAGSIVYDASSGKNQGIFQGSPLWASASSCRVGSCLSFDGATTGVQVTDAHDVLRLTNSLTLSAWIRVASAGTYKIITRSASASTDWKYELGISSHTVEFGIKTGTWNTYNGSTTLTPGVWYHVVGTYDGSHIMVYVNGVSDHAPQTLVGPIASSDTESVWIGMNGGSTQYFNGNIDDVRIYNRALSATEIQDLYESY